MIEHNEYGRPYPNGASVRLQALIDAVCSSHGVSIGRWNDKSTWRLDPKDEATPEQIAEAEAIMAAFDPWPEIAFTRADMPYDAMVDGANVIQDVTENQTSAPYTMGPIHDAYQESFEPGQPVQDLAALKESLRLRVVAEAVRQSGLSANVLARVIELTNTLNNENTDEEARTSAQLELEQHNEYREKATLVEAAKQRKLEEIDAIETVEDALAYSVEDGWP